MPRREKPIPRSQRISFNRGTKVSRNSPGAKDDVKNFTVGIMDMDSSILYYFNEVIKPEVEVNKEKVKVPCLYASPERWVAMQTHGYLRDKKRQIITPLIVYKRTSMAKNTDISIDKLDANKPTQFYSFEKKFTQQNRYDKFSVLQNLSPEQFKELMTGIVKTELEDFKKEAFDVERNLNAAEKEIGKQKNEKRIYGYRKVH